MCMGSSWNGRSLMTGQKKTKNMKKDILLGPLGSKVYDKTKEARHAVRGPAGIAGRVVN